MSKEQIKNQPQTQAPILSIKNLEKHYGNNGILKDVSVDIQKGEIISIIGPSGTGKSTFLRGINMLDPPTGGLVYFGGDVVTKKNADKFRKKMLMVFQNFGLYSHLNALDNVALAPRKILKMNKQQALQVSENALKAVGLSERAKHFPSQLSGGQKQRVAIARCLAMQPEVILFDEPTSALDPTMVGEVMAVIRNLASTGITMLIVTHEMNLAKDISSRVLFMNDGGIYESGTPEEIFENPQQPKTKEFVFRIRTFNFEMQSSNFDYLKMITDLEYFFFKNGVSGKIFEKTRLITEELMTNIISKQTQKASLNVEYSEVSKNSVIKITYPGENQNLLETSDDLISTSIVEKSATKVQHSFDEGLNTIEVTVA
jgi:polar amino acid transport system ATP-binding protein